MKWWTWKISTVKVHYHDDFFTHNNKKSYLLDLFAALSIKCGSKIIPNHGNTTFLGSRFEHFQTLINGVLIRSGEME